MKSQYSLSTNELATAVLEYLAKTRGLSGNVTNCAMDVHHLVGHTCVMIVTVDIEESKPPPSPPPLPQP